MIESGILVSGDPIELIDGFLVQKDRSAAGEDPMSVGNAHARAIEKLTDLMPRLKRLGCYIRIQLPVTIPDYSEPEPDGAIVREDYRRWADGHPQPQDVTCVIEAADSSLANDRSYKQQIYADAGIAQYLIVNLVDDIVEEYTEPEQGNGRYARVTPHARSKQIQLLTAGKPLVISTSKLLP